MDDIEPYQPGALEKLMLKADKGEIPNIYGWNVGGFYPRLQSIAAGSKTAIGVRFWQPEIGDTDLDVHGSAFYSVTGYQYYDFQLGQIPHPAGALPLRAANGTDLYELGSDPLERARGLILYGSFQYRRYTRLDYFGSGPGSSAESHSSFLGRGPSVELIGGYQLNPNIALRARGGFFRPRIDEGENPDLPTTQEIFDEESAPGLTRQPDFLTGSLQLLLDYRDVPGAPGKGAMLALEYARFDDRDLQEFSFNRFSFDARGYLPLGSRQRVLALRGYLTLDETDSGNRVPFYFQEALGGSQTLRGYENFRFRGEKLLLLQAEYRWEAAPILELAFFVDAGTVSREDASLDLDDLKTDWGFGLRFKNWRAVFLRLEVAKSNETTRLVFNTNAVF
jgi:hypothetical protein